MKTFFSKLSAVSSKPNKTQRFDCLPSQLVRQVLVQKERSLFRCHMTWIMEDSHLKNHLSFWLKPAVLIGIGRKGFFSYPNVFLAIGVLRLYPFFSLAFSMLCVRPSSCHHLSQWGRPPLLQWLFYSNNFPSQNLKITWINGWRSHLL